MHFAKSVPFVLLAAAPLAAAQGPGYGPTQGEVKVGEPILPYFEDIKPPGDNPALPKLVEQFEVAPPREVAPTGEKMPEAVAQGFQNRGVREPRLFLDQPGDGAIWAMGRGVYKVRFDEQGAMFVPKLPDAPQNYPVTFSLESVSVGDSLLGLTPASPVLAGETVYYDRGGVIEQYDLRVDSMEQLFTFQSLPNGGELVLTIGVETELTTRFAAAGLEFFNDLGGVTYSNAIAIDATGAWIEAPTQLIAGGIQITVPESFVGQAVLPLTIDPIVNRFPISVDPTEDDFLPDVAFDESNNVYCVVWQNWWSTTDQDIYAELYTPGGVAVAGSQITIDFTTDCWTKGVVANNQIANQFLIVAQTSGSCGPPFAIEGRTRDAASTSTGSQFQISAGFFGDKINPDVGGDPVTAGPTYYCVTWARGFNANDTDDQRRPAVSKSDGHRPFSTQQWNVVWEEIFNSSDHDIYGSQLLWNGSITNSQFLIDFSGLNHRNPSASSLLDGDTDPRPYLVAYDQRSGNTGDRDIRAAALIGPDVIDRVTVTDVDGASGATGDDFLTPSTDSNGCQFLVTYKDEFISPDYDIYCSTFYLSGETLHLSESQNWVSFSIDVEGEPEVCAAGTATSIFSPHNNRYFIVGKDGVGCSCTAVEGDGDIEGGTWDGLHNHGACIGTNYCGPAQNNSTGTGGVIVATGSAEAGGNPLNLLAKHLPNNQFGYFLGSMNTGFFQPPGSQGFICLGNPIARFNAQVGNTGVVGAFNVDINTNAIPVPMGGPVPITPGQTWNFQGWYRDIGNNNNFTDGVSILFR